MPDPRTADRLLAAAWDEIDEGGVDALTLAGVAARAGVSRQAVYLHFGSRAALLVEVAAWIDKSSGFRRAVAAARAHPPRPALQALLRAWFDYLPTILPVALALEGAALSGADGADAYRDRMADWHAGLGLAVTRVLDASPTEAAWSADEATDWVWATVHPTHVHHLVHERGWDLALAEERLTAAALAIFDDLPH